MTDMRATERLLEAIDQCAMEIEIGRPVEFPARHIREAVEELRRRGDTLVRRDDLREVLEELDDVGGRDPNSAAYDRLKNAT